MRRLRELYTAQQPTWQLSSQREASAFRNREIGYVWQFHYLLPEFSALENVAMPLLARGTAKREALALAANWLREVDLEDRSDHRPGELSGGEQQRVALARALVGNPRLLLADEPTGDLDETTAGRVFDLLERLHVTHGLTSILVTHNLDLAARCSRTLRLEGGRLHVLGKAPEAGFQTGNAWIKQLSGSYFESDCSKGNGTMDESCTRPASRGWNLRRARLREVGRSEFRSIPKGCSGQYRISRGLRRRSQKKGA